MIVAERLTKRLGKVKAVDSIDLTVPDGEAVAIFGPNGAGKSTLLRLLAGILRPTAGTVTIDGRDPRQVKRRIGYLGHEPFLYGYLSAEENLRFFTDLYGLSRDQAALSLERVKMRHKAGMRVNELSQGETRRVALARALLHDPEYLLLDEPFSNLDQQTADLVHTLIKRPGRTVLLVTHDVRRGLSICSRSICLDSGRFAGEAPSIPLSSAQLQEYR